MLLVMAFFGTCAAVLAHVAMTNDRELIFNGIPFSVQGANIFYGVLAALSLGFVLLAFMGVLTALRNETRLRLTETEIDIPPLMFRKGRVVAYRDLEKFEMTETKHAKFATLHTAEGKVHISENMLPKFAYVAVCDAIEAGWAHEVALRNKARDRDVHAAVTAILGRESNQR